MIKPFAEVMEKEFAYERVLPDGAAEGSGSASALGIALWAAERSAWIPVRDPSERKMSFDALSGHRVVVRGEPDDLHTIESLYAALTWEYPLVEVDPSRRGRALSVAEAALKDAVRSVAPQLQPLLAEYARAGFEVVLGQIDANTPTRAVREWTFRVLDIGPDDDEEAANVEVRRILKGHYDTLLVRDCCVHALARLEGGVLHAERIEAICVGIAKMAEIDALPPAAGRDIKEMCALGDKLQMALDERHWAVTFAPAQVSTGMSLTGVQLLERFNAAPQAFQVAQGHAESRGVEAGAVVVERGFGPADVPEEVSPVTFFDARAARRNARFSGEQSASVPYRQSLYGALVRALLPQPGELAHERQETLSAAAPL